MEYLTAKEARNITDNVITGAAKEQLETILGQVQHSARLGHNYISLSVSIFPNVRTKLDLLGYTVQAGGSRDDFNYLIKW